MKSKIETEHPEWLALCQYQKHVVALLDVLGFSELVNDTSKNTMFAGLYSTINGLRDMKEELDGLNMGGLKSTVLSDSIVLSYIASETDAFVKLARATHSILSSFANENIVLRGSMTCGLLWHEDNIVFGPALIKANQLEKTSAIYPRCIVDPDAQKELFGLETKNLIRKGFSIDDDGLLYYDFYLNMLYADRDDGFRSEKIARIRANLIHHLETVTNIGIRQKYAWCANHFNRAIAYLKDETGDYQVHLAIPDNTIDRTQ